MTREEFYKLSDDEQFKATEALVESNDNETHELWCQYSREAAQMGEPVRAAYDWVQISRGMSPTVGHIEVDGEKMPVVFCIFWNLINGHVVGFYSACSQVVDHRMVDKYLDKWCPKAKMNTTDAMNFHNTLSRLGLDVA